MAAKYEIEKFNGNNFSLWKMKMKAVLRKNNCLVAIGERPMEITNDKWNEVDGNAISDLHLALADGVLSSVAEKNTAKEIWDTLTKLYEAKKIWLSQKNYLKKILRRFNMQDCKSISTPLPVNFKLSSSMCPSNEAERKEMSRVPYASAVGSLMFAMICTRPDIAQAVGVVSRYMANPGGEPWIAVKRILRYIRGTSDVALCYGGSEFTVKGYVDSDFAGDLDKRKSTTGYVFTFAGAAVSWVSKLQTVVALSTTEAEYMAATQACKEAIWIQRLLEELGHKQQKIPVFCDSQSALHIARNPAFHSRTKHIGVQYHFVREVVEDGSMDLQKIHTKENLADVLTKPINTDKFVWSRSSCGLAET
ncbi:hypothetical protein KPL70_014703 [Citrus sinensis]|nr:hypothetical protein KPL70_014703 [Citrus sinensis]